jgi:peroxiredoxin Q/BCP
MTHLKAGDKAPDFSAVIEDGSTVSSADYAGKKLVLFFYPKDNTPGCTAEVCDLRDNFDALKAQGYSLLGVSPDSEKKHQNFIAKFELPFSLIADTDLKVIKDFGCWGLKKFMGREFEGVYRTTFLIGSDGLIEEVITKVKTKEHSNQILK